MAWDQETRQRAVDLYVAEGATAASEQTGASVRSILRWANDAGLSQARAEQTEAARAALARRHAEMREEVRLRLLEKVVDILDRLDITHHQVVTLSGTKDTPGWWEKVPLDLPSASDVKSYATAAAILIDKYRLEMGEHTTASRNEGTDDVDRRIRQLVDEHERQRQADVQPAPVG